MQTVEIGKRNLHAEDHWEQLDLANLKFDKPTVLCLSGNGTITNESANGFAKQAETYLDLLFKNKTGKSTLDYVDIMSVKYAQYSGYRSAGALTRQAIEQLSNAMLALLVDSNGKRLNVESAQKNLSRISFFTFCAGNQELQKIVTRLNEKMAQIGYHEYEINVINDATLEVSFAPLSGLNKVPSVRVYSAKDEMLLTPLDAMLSYEEQSTMNGIYLHQDEPGSLYGWTRNADTARSIQIFSTNLLNAYYDSTKQPYHYPDEHDVSLTARNQNWHLRPAYVNDTPYQSPNADCVSQMMAWALCRGVENSMQNFQADQYVPNTYWDELMPELKSIINSYDQKELTRNPARETAIRKNKFEELRRQKRLDLARHLKINPSVETVEHELSRATNFEEVMAICEKYDYQHTAAILPKLDFLTHDERLALQIAKENQANQVLPHKEKPKWEQFDYDYDKCEKTLPEILKVFERYDYFGASDMKGNLTDDQYSMVLKIGRIKLNKVYDKMQFVKVPSFEEMVDAMNHANSLEAVIAYLKKHDFLGVEYVLPDVQVLTDAEKNSILIMAGKQPTKAMPQEIVMER